MDVPARPPAGGDLAANRRIQAELNHHLDLTLGYDTLHVADVTTHAAGGRLIDKGHRSGRSRFDAVARGARRGEAG